MRKLIAALVLSGVVILPLAGCAGSSAPEQSGGSGVDIDMGSSSGSTNTTNN